MSNKGNNNTINGDIIQINGAAAKDDSPAVSEDKRFIIKLIAEKYPQECRSKDFRKSLSNAMDVPRDPLYRILASLKVVP